MPPGIATSHDIALSAVVQSMIQGTLPAVALDLLRQHSTLRPRPRTGAFRFASGIRLSTQAAAQRTNASLDAIE